MTENCFTCFFVVDTVSKIFCHTQGLECGFVLASEAELLLSKYVVIFEPKIYLFKDALQFIDLLRLRSKVQE